MTGYNSLITVKFIHQVEGHIEVKGKYLHPFKFYVYFLQVGGLHLTECVLVGCNSFKNFFITLSQPSGFINRILTAICLHVLIGFRSIRICRLDGFLGFVLRG